jgi:hypothetical protein
VNLNIDTDIRYLLTSVSVLPDISVVMKEGKDGSFMPRNVVGGVWRGIELSGSRSDGFASAGRLHLPLNKTSTGVKNKPVLCGNEKNCLSDQESTP